MIFTNDAEENVKANLEPKLDGIDNVIAYASRSLKPPELSCIQVYVPCFKVASQRNVP